MDPPLQTAAGGDSPVHGTDAARKEEEGNEEEDTEESEEEDDDSSSEEEDDEEEEEEDEEEEDGYSINTAGIVDDLTMAALAAGLGDMERSSTNDQQQQQEAPAAAPATVEVIDEENAGRLLQIAKEIEKVS